MSLVTMSLLSTGENSILRGNPLRMIDHDHLDRHFLPLQAREVEGLFNRELRFQVREEHREPEYPATSPKVRRERGPEMQLAWE